MKKLIFLLSLFLITGLGLTAQTPVHYFPLNEWSTLPGVDDLLGWDFTSGWDEIDPVTINDLNTFTTTSTAGITSANIVTVGNMYRMWISGTTTATDFRVRQKTTNTLLSSINTTGFFSESFIFQADNEAFYLRNNGAGETTINSMSIRQLDQRSLEVQHGYMGTNTDTWNTQDERGSGIREYELNYANDEEITIPDVVAIQDNFDDGGTFIVKVYPESDGASNGGRILSKGSSWRMYVENESTGLMEITFWYDFSTGDGEWSTTATVLPINQWSVISVEYDNSNVANTPTLKITNSGTTTTYIVGSGLMAAQTPTGTRVTDVGSDLIIGNQTGVVRTFDGGFSDVLLFNYNASNSTTSWSADLADGLFKMPWVDQGADNSDINSGYDFTSGWTVTGAGTTIDDADSYTTIATYAGIRKSAITTIGKTYRYAIAGTSTSDLIQFQDYGGTTNYHAITGGGAFSVSGTFTDIDGGLRFKSQSTGTTDVTTFTITELGSTLSLSPDGITDNTWIDYLQGISYPVTGATAIISDKSNLGATWFNGATSNINIDDVLSDLASTTQGTWMATVWASRETPSTTNIILSFNDTNAAEFIAFQIRTDGTLRANISDAGVAQFTLTTTAALDTGAHHIVLVQNSISPILYVDGIAVAQSFSVTTDKTAWFSDLTGLDNGRIGCYKADSGANDLFFDGTIKGVKFFKTALTADEVLREYQIYQN